jgi:FKBP-type peptidyl-prolyl cis-trans isomerase (trigger factor)
MKRLSGFKLLEEREGAGKPANKGDEVPLNAKQVEHLPKEMIRVEGGVTFVDHKPLLGSRQTMAGVEHALMGMKVGGYRKVRISPHLAYRDKGIPDLIPPDAVLICEIWLRDIGVPFPRKALLGVI